jgi:DNA repair protein RecO (recombination protein O)
MAKGARRPSSKLVGHLEPLTRLELSLAQGRNLDVITQVQSLESFSLLKRELEALSKGLYLAELAEGFAAEEMPSQPLYHLLLPALRFIAQYPPADLVLRHFEINLLCVSGFMPRLYQCAECGKEPLAGRHVFSPQHGGLMCITCLPKNDYALPLSSDGLGLLRQLANAQLDSISKITTSPSATGEVSHVLSSTLKYWLEREVHSSSFVSQVSRSHVQQGTGR